MSISPSRGPSREYPQGAGGCRRARREERILLSVALMSCQWRATIRLHFCLPLYHCTGVGFYSTARLTIVVIIYKCLGHPCSDSRRLLDVRPYCRLTKENSLQMSLHCNAIAHPYLTLAKYGVAESVKTASMWKMDNECSRAKDPGKQSMPACGGFLFM